MWFTLSGGHPHSASAVGQAVESRVDLTSAAGASWQGGEASERAPLQTPLPPQHLGSAYIAAGPCWSPALRHGRRGLHQHHLPWGCRPLLHLLCGCRSLLVPALRHNKPRDPG